LVSMRVEILLPELYSPKSKRSFSPLFFFFFLVKIVALFPLPCMTASPPLRRIGAHRVFLSLFLHPEPPPCSFRVSWPALPPRRLPRFFFSHDGHLFFRDGPSFFSFPRALSPAAVVIPAFPRSGTPQPFFFPRSFSHEALPSPCPEGHALCSFSSAVPETGRKRGEAPATFPRLKEDLFLA